MNLVLDNLVAELVDLGELIAFIIKVAKSKNKAAMTLLVLFY